LIFVETPKKDILKYLLFILLIMVFGLSPSYLFYYKVNEKTS